LTEFGNTVTLQRSYI